ncbi:hypothetical protein [Thioalbus denitrificans]|nr:hypothetical protein [Thioalbus denitrificans]
MPDRYSRIFLLSHMRAYTSLAGHILGSNPAINGYFEMHLGYEDAGALDRQLAEYRKHEDLKDGSRYLFDKLLHNDYRLLPERLGQARLKILVGIRPPEPTLKSIVDLFERKGGNEAYASPEAATRYYTERLEWLADFCRARAGAYFYFDAELFRARPQALLTALSNWLELEEPLSGHYQVFSQTGKARRGDSSAFIHRGEIARGGADYPHVRIPRQLLDQAQATYLRCRRQMVEFAADAILLEASSPP